MKKTRLRQIDKNDSKIVIIKIVFLLSLLALAFLAPKYLQPIRTTKPAKKISLRMPTYSDLQKLLDFSQISSKATEIGRDFQTQVLGKTDKILTKTASDAASVVSETVSKEVFDKAIKPVVQKINDLPPDQQRRAKELICK